MTKKYFLNNISYFFLVLIILSFPFNYKIFLFFRPQDIFVLGFIFLQIRNLNINQITLILIILFFISLSSVIGYYHYETFYYYKLAFFYKLIIPIIFLFLFLNYLKTISVDKILIYCHTVFLFYLSYVIILYFFFKGSYFVNVPILPSSISIFSGEKPDEIIDKHIMGSIVGFYFTLNILYFLISFKESSKKNYQLFLFLLIFLIFVKLFESRGLAIYFLFTFYIVLDNFFQNYIPDNYKFKLSISSSISGLILLILTLNYIKGNWYMYDLDYYYKIYISEVLEVGLHADRAVSWFRYLPENFLLLMFGGGVLHFNTLFLDNGLLFLLLSFGIIPLIIIINFCLKNFNLKIQSHYSIKLLLALSIIINLFVSEYFLISRYIYIVMIMFLLFEAKAKSSDTN